MSLQPLQLETLHEYDQGSLAILVNKAIRRIYFDLDDRPRVGKSRKLTVELEFKPIEEDGNLVEVEVAAKVKDTIPNQETRTNILVPNSDGLLFNPMVTRASHPTLEFPPDAD